MNFSPFCSVHKQRKSNCFVFSIFNLWIFLLNPKLWTVCMWQREGEWLPKWRSRNNPIKVSCSVCLFGDKTFQFSDYLPTPKITIISYKQEGWGFCVFANLRIKELRVCFWVHKGQWLFFFLEPHPTGEFAFYSFCLGTEDFSAIFLLLTPPLLLSTLQLSTTAISPWWQISPHHTITDAKGRGGGVVLALSLLPIHTGSKI